MPNRAIGAGLDGTDNANYKYAIQNYGAVDVAILADNGMVSGYSSPYWNQANKALYYIDNGTTPVAHAVALVGWDDNYAASNFSTAPPGNGAFIAKNQWGAAWGNGGYFYISYYSLLIDAHVFRKPESTANYARSYLYDPFGQTSSYGYGSDTAWGANVFTVGCRRNIAVGRLQHDGTKHRLRNIRSTPVYRARHQPAYSRAGRSIPPDRFPMPAITRSCCRDPCQ